MHVAQDIAFAELILGRNFECLACGNGDATKTLGANNGRRIIPHCHSDTSEMNPDVFYQRSVFNDGIGRERRR